MDNSGLKRIIYAAKENQAVLEEVNKQSFGLKYKKTNLLRLRTDIKHKNRNEKRGLFIFKRAGQENRNGKR